MLDGTLVINRHRVQHLSKHDAMVLLERATQEPLFFAQHILGAELWHKQRKIFRAVFEHPRVAVKACHASGKTYAAAAIVLTYVHTVYPATVITTAPVGRQVQHILWREINKMLGKSKFPLGGEPLATMYRLGEESMAIGISTDDPEKIQGFHGENVLVVVDEAAGIQDHIMEAVESILAGGNARLLMLGNPSRLDGAFHRAFNDRNESPLYKKFTISAFDTPNVRHRRTLIPGLITHQWVKERKKIWGADHPLYRIKVLGEFPHTSYSNLAIPPYLLDIARETELPPKATDRIIVGIDVGEYGDSETAVAVRHGDRLLALYAWSIGDMEHQIAKIVEIIYSYASKAPVLEVRIDKIGVGYGLYEELRKRTSKTKGHIIVVGVDVRERPIHPEMYFDSRTECWMEFRNKLANREVDLSVFDKSGLEKEELYMQLTTPRYNTDDRTARIRMETSRDVVKRGIKLDRATAVVLAYYDAYMERARVFTPPSPVAYEGLLKYGREREGEAPWREQTW